MQDLNAKEGILLSTDARGEVAEAGIERMESGLHEGLPLTIEATTNYPQVAESNRTSNGDPFTSWEPLASEQLKVCGNSRGSNAKLHISMEKQQARHANIDDTMRPASSIPRDRQDVLQQKSIYQGI